MGPGQEGMLQWPGRERVLSEERGLTGLALPLPQPRGPEHWAADRLPVLPQ